MAIIQGNHFGVQSFLRPSTVKIDIPAQSFTAWKRRNANYRLRTRRIFRSGIRIQLDLLDFARTELLHLRLVAHQTTIEINLRFAFPQYGRNGAYSVAPCSRQITHHIGDAIQFTQKRILNRHDHAATLQHIRGFAAFDYNACNFILVDMQRDRPHVSSDRRDDLSAIADK